MSGRMAQDQRGSGYTGSSIRRPISDESWVEVSSRPSSSSLSSAGTDDIVPLQSPGTQENTSRRRRLFRPAVLQGRGRVQSRTFEHNGNSAEEYGESEADSDRVMSSSVEDLEPRFHVDRSSSGLEPPSQTVDTSYDDSDEIATALGPVDNNSTFTPQPNVFSHPPSRHAVRQDDSYFPPLPSSHTSSSRPTIATSSASRIDRSRQHARSHTPYTMLAPNASIDHDAALRASLSTLLSCAAAARGLQKGETALSNRSTAPPQTRPANSMEPMALRIVPASILSQIEERTTTSQPSPPASDIPRSPSSLPSKRKAKSPVRDKRKKNRSVYGGSAEDLVNVSPTLTTWVFGAGVLVLFSAISFTAGYTLGKEVGRAGAMHHSNPLNCASEVDTGSIGRELSKRSAWRWGNASSVRV